MTDNLIEQLREELHEWEIELAIEQRKQAADRIEQLEAALREVVKVDCGFVCKCAEIARTALEDNK
jgi:hypothetical protein